MIHFVDKFDSVSSKDMTIKLWDTTIQHCFHTIVSHRTEVEKENNNLIDLKFSIVFQ